MISKNIFKQAYLRSLGLVCEDVEEPVEQQEQEQETPVVKQVCFKTSDEILLDALNSGFEEVVIFTNAKDEATGEDTVVEVKFGKDSFGDVEITDVEEDENPQEDDEPQEDDLEECGNTFEEDEDMFEENKDENMFEEEYEDEKIEEPSSTDAQ